MAETPDGKPSGRITIAFLQCDRLADAAIEKHGNYSEVIHNLFEPLVPKHLRLETRCYDVLNKREYPRDEELDEIDAIIISGSFEDDAHTDATWILRLAGYLIKIHVRSQFDLVGSSITLLSPRFQCSR